MFSSFTLPLSADASCDIFLESQNCFTNGMISSPSTMSANLRNIARLEIESSASGQLDSGQFWVSTLIWMTWANLTKACGGRGKTNAKFWVEGLHPSALHFCMNCVCPSPFLPCSPPPFFLQCRAPFLPCTPFFSAQDFVLPWMHPRKQTKASDRVTKIKHALQVWATQKVPKSIGLRATLKCAESETKVTPIHTQVKECERFLQRARLHMEELDQETRHWSGQGHAQVPLMPNSITAELSTWLEERHAEMNGETDTCLGIEFQIVKRCRASDGALVACVREGEGVWGSTLIWMTWANLT